MSPRLSTLLNMSERRRPTFDEALAAARQGAPWALGWLYRRFQPGLLRMLAVIAPHQAEDLASDVWLEVAGALSKFEGDEPAFRTWLATTARRRVIDAHRRAGRRPVRVAETDGMDARAGGDRTEDETVDYMASVAAIARVVSVLSPDQAHVVLMRVVGGLDVDEVARALGKQPGAVRSLQHRALRRLARQLDPQTLSA
ncbi:MAG TPA: sigma-70 family RNA polymerase sigma factor [Actinomycetes bacterium]|nr:sigma-70 family RNA polymerase sigma factor [Actinomycetes bacterium]